MIKYNTNERSNEWLEDLMFDIWENHFDDVPRQNVVLIQFGKKSKRQLGCLKAIKKPTRLMLDKINSQDFTDIKSVSMILITSLFKHIDVPENVVRGTIAHEICHYAHGFNSPLPKLYSHPHKGNIIKKELSKRDLISIYDDSNKWLKSNWRQFVQQF